MSVKEKTLMDELVEREERERSDSSDGGIDPIEGLRQLEKLISEAKEFDSKHKISFNGNKMLNDLLDKPIGAKDEDKSDEEEVVSEDEEPDVEDEDIDDIEENGSEEKGLKRTNDEIEDEEETEEQLNEDINNKSNGVKKNNKKSKNKQKKQKKSTNPSLRKNIKSILNENDLDLETRLARKEEEERIARQRERSHQRWQELQSQQMLSQLDTTSSSIDMSFSQRFAEIPDEVLLSSDEEEDKRNSMPKRSKFLDLNSGLAEVIDLSSSDDESTPNNHLNTGYSTGLTHDYNLMGAYDDDDISIIGTNTMDTKPEVNFEDVNNCGSHTDDNLNVPDAEGRVIVNVAHPPEDPDIYLAPQIARAVKPHQIGGIRFLYDNVVEQLNIHNKSSGFGCILSHSMGLGKTMQVIAFTDVFLTHTSGKYVLCIVPINTLQNWIAEFNIWLPEENATIDKYFKKNEPMGDVKYRNFKVFAINEAKSMTTRAKEILKWRKFGGVLLLGYEMYRILTSDNRTKSKKDEDIDPKIFDQINSEVKASLIDPGPDLVVCDEGHRIKNCNAATSLALKNIKTKRRIVLTGYPLQNKLLEYWCMVDFVRPNYLGLKGEFTNMFERPINNGQCLDSTPHDRQIMKYRAHVLYQLLKGFVQRRSHIVLQKALPLKCEYVLMCRMTQIQKDLMLAFLDTAIHDPDSIGTVKGRISTLTLFAVCCKVWNHPDVVYDIVRKGIVCDDLDIEIPTKNSNNKPKNNRKKKLNNDLNANTDSLNQSLSTVSAHKPFTDLNELPTNLFNTPLRQKNDGVLDFSWAEHKLRSYIPGLIENSYKMILLFEIMAESIALGDRLLVFSQSLLTLDLIERFLQSRDVPKTRTKWCKNQTYYRLDGSTSTHEREKYINLFNNTNTALLFLISTRAGSLGINLIGANRIVIFDASWNPCHDAQAACRIYRYGQPKPCYIYRLVCDNSLEKKIYDRQVNKQGMANRVVDEQNVEANFTWREIHSLLDDLHEIKEPPIEVYSEQQLSKFSDELIKRICVKLNHSITRLPFEHESLLLDRKEQKLSSAEKRIAFGNYNEAKRAKAQQFDFPSPYGSLRHSMAARNSFTNPFTGNSRYNMSLPYNMSTLSPLPTQMTPMFNNGMPCPDVSQPLPPYPPQPRGYNFPNFESIAETLVRSGHSVKKVRMPNDLSISVGPNGNVNIKKGEEIMVIRTEKGLYLKTTDGSIISIKDTNNLFSSQTMPSFMPISNNDSFGIIQPNLHCGGTVHCAPSHSRASSTVSHPPEVVQLSDDEDSQDNPDITHSLNGNSFDTTLNIDSEPSVMSNGSVVNGSNNTSLMPSEQEDNQSMDSLNHSNPESIETNSINQTNDYLIESQNEPLFESLLESSVANSVAYDSVPDPISSFFSSSSTSPSSQLNRSSIVDTLDI